MFSPTEEEYWRRRELHRRSTGPDKPKGGRRGLLWSLVHQRHPALGSHDELPCDRSLPLVPRPSTQTLQSDGSRPLPLPRLGGLGLPLCRDSRRRLVPTGTCLCRLKVPSKPPRDERLETYYTETKPSH